MLGFLWLLLSARKRRLLQELGEASATSPATAVTLARTLGPVEAAALARLEQARLVHQPSPEHFYLQISELAAFRRKTRQLLFLVVSLVAIALFIVIVM